MSKRLNKRQQRELDELALQEAQAPVVVEEGESEEEVEVPKRGAVVNAFAALNEGMVEDEEESEIEEEDVVQKKSNKKKKKKKKTTSTSTPSEPTESTTPKKGKKGKDGKKDEGGEDELDRALKELGMGPSTHTLVSEAQTPSTSFSKLRSLLAVDPKSLDPEAELKRFFGSKIISSSSSTSQNPRLKTALAIIAKTRYTLVKPKPTWPTVGLLGLGVRELTVDEVAARDERHRYEREGKGGGEEEGGRWWTFVHSGEWREVQRQFLGAVRSHDPNQLSSLLSIFPYHTDTLLQLSLVYQQQNDTGSASDYVERAMWGMDRALGGAAGGTGVGLGGAGGGGRLDFDRVENRGLFLALHRNIAHLARRGLFTTAFATTKLLLSLSPLSDPHGALLWAEFLALKSNNLTWLEEARAVIPRVERLVGWEFAGALGMRMGEEEDHTKSDEALRKAILRFPQVVAILADKAGFTLPGWAREMEYFRMQVAYEDHPQTATHLMAHIYATRSAPLWKDASNSAWFRAQLEYLHTNNLIPSGGSPTPTPSIGGKGKNVLPEWLIRHAYLSEGFMGWLPPSLTQSLGHAYDPFPPSTSITQYDSSYFANLTPTPRARRTQQAQGEAELADPGLMRVRERLVEWLGLEEGEREEEGGFFQMITRTLRGLMENPAYVQADEGRREVMNQDLMNQVMGAMMPDQDSEDGEADGDMPGAFPH